MARKTLTLKQKRPASRPAVRRELRHVERWLRAMCPFMTESVPLALGFQKQVMKSRPEHITRTQLREYLKIYTSRNTYFRALRKTGAVRFNCDGSVQGRVSAKDAQRAGSIRGQ